MFKFHDDSEFAASLDPIQREYFLGRVAERQHQLQDALRDLSRSLSAISTFNAESMTLLSTDESPPRRILSVDGVEYRYATIPGSRRLKLSTANGVSIAMWDGAQRNPWVMPLEGYAAFLASGHAKDLNRLLCAVDLRRCSNPDKRP